MTTFQKVCKYLAMAFAAFLAFSIVSGIISAIGLFGGFFTQDAVAGDLTTYAVSSDIRSLHIEINAADLCIKESDGFSAESNLKHLSVMEKNGTLILKETRKFTGTYTDAALTLFVPAGTVFETAEIITGAGRLSADALSADTITLTLGAGEVIIGKLSAAGNAKIEGGAGKVTVLDGALHNLNLEMGVGECNLTSALGGHSELELGIGESNITVLGSKADYTLDIEKGLGSITVDGETVSMLEGSGNGPNSMEITGGIGAIHLKFNESAAE